MDLLKGGRRGFSNTGIDSTAVVEGKVKNSVIGANVIIEEGAQVNDSVILEGSKVQRGSVVSNSIIGFQTSIGKKATVASLSVIGHGVQVPDKAKIIESTLSKE